MLDETIDLLTRQMLEDVFNDKKNKQKQICTFVIFVNFENSKN